MQQKIWQDQAAHPHRKKTRQDIPGVYDIQSFNGRCRYVATKWSTEDFYTRPSLATPPGTPSYATHEPWSSPIGTARKHQVHIPCHWCPPPFIRAIPDPARDACIRSSFGADVTLWHPMLRRRLPSERRSSYKHRCFQPALVLSSTHLRPPSLLVTAMGLCRRDGACVNLFLSASSPQKPTMPPPASWAQLRLAWPSSRCRFRRGHSALLLSCYLTFKIVTEAPMVNLFTPPSSPPLRRIREARSLPIPLPFLLGQCLNLCTTRGQNKEDLGPLAMETSEQ